MQNKKYKVIQVISGNAKALGNLYLARSASQEELSRLKNHVDGIITTDISPEDANSLKLP